MSRICFWLLSGAETPGNEVILTPHAEFDFLADAWNELHLADRMKTPRGRNEPFVVDFGA